MYVSYKQVILFLLLQDKLFPYAEENAKGFLESEWENEHVKEAVAALRKQAAEDQEKSVEGLVAIPGEVNYLLHTSAEPTNVGQN